MRRIVVPEGSLVEGELSLPHDAAQHVRDVLRLERGAALLLSDGAGREARADVIEASKRSVRVLIEGGAIRELARPPSLQLSLLQCVAKGEKMDAVVRQATELGVASIVPVLSARAVARLESRVDRWRAIAEDATRVSGRPFRPAIEAVQPLSEVLARPRAPVALCFAGGAEMSLGDHLDHLDHLGSAPPASAEVLIGPEGGLDESEVARAKEAGFSPVHLGAFTLRTETAGPAVLAIMMYWARAIAR